VSTRPSPTISVCIVCRNEADRLGPCLDSVTGWADEVVVMDLESTDGSRDVARAHGAHVLEREPQPVVEAFRNEVAGAATGEWILALDPDERVASGLPAELRRQAAREEIDIVSIPVMNFDFGYPASHPMHRYDPKPRFYRRAAVSWPTFPNALPRVDPARQHELPRRDDLVLIHDRNRTIPEAIDRVARYAPAQAQAMVDRGERFTVKDMLRTLGDKAYREFVVGRPWRDGVPGVLRAGTLVGFHFYVWAAFWQLSGAGRAPDDDRLLRRIGQGIETLRLPGRAAKRVARLARTGPERTGGSR
jgi:glycosyltransferase involved in cell wall biosynthesis